jgi:hypothetical protein
LLRTPLTPPPLVRPSTPPGVSQRAFGRRPPHVRRCLFAGAAGRAGDGVVIVLELDDAVGRFDWMGRAGGEEVGKGHDGYRRINGHSGFGSNNAS